MLDGTGEALVEGRVALDIDRFVRKFVQQHCGEAHVAAADERIEQGIVEPPERREGLDAADVNIMSRAFLTPRFFHRAIS
ncbi:MAG: hypothetical protein U5O39_19845 [Gammaproteobacteria bacterium]|nr:hypothetical protein [Gammaproteobacteria bacterium]